MEYIIFAGVLCSVGIIVALLRKKARREHEEVVATLNDILRREREEIERLKLSEKNLRRRIELLEEEVEKGPARLHRELLRSRTDLGESAAREAALRTELRSVMRSVLPVPFAPDMAQAFGASAIHLPIVKSGADGIATVIVPGSYGYYKIHRNPEYQTEKEREEIYRAIRDSPLVRAELAIGIVWETKPPAQEHPAPAPEAGHPR